MEYGAQNDEEGNASQTQLGIQEIDLQGDVFTNSTDIG